MNIGDYVRTRDGNIAKYIGYNCFHNFDNYVLDEATGVNDELLNEILIKSSPNIIDLIEEGDYVNGLKVEGVNNEIKGFGTIIFSKDSSIMEDYIYSIVTKEQFESMEYKIGGK